MIQEILLENDRRKIASLIAQALPKNHLEQCGEKLLQPDHRNILIATGFLVKKNTQETYDTLYAQETDGPPGALYLGKCLADLGKKITFVANEYCIEMFKECLDFPAKCYSFPVLDQQKSNRLSDQILAKVNPDFLISIECCGRNEDGKYRDMRGQDISFYTPKIDSLFLQVGSKIPTIAIGDGGNEIGFGRIPKEFFQSLNLEPSTISADDLIVAAVSNWGAYGLITVLSGKRGTNLLPTSEEEAALIRKLVALGAVDGVSGNSVPRVDGMSRKENTLVIKKLHRCLEQSQQGR